jgi:hypothetical protein
MNKERYNPIIDEAYKDYCDSFNSSHIEPNSKELFIDKCKHNIEYSIRWGLEIEERYLNPEERFKYWFDIKKPNRLVVDEFDQWSAGLQKIHLDDCNIPTKLITITYKNETIETYE